jgi:tRNA(His) guanylyltransferase
MDSDLFEDKMRALEVYHKIKVPEDKWIVLRIDGRNFSNLTEKLFDKPFDDDFSYMMEQTTHALVKELDALYGYVESDEISILLPKNTTWFDREVEKLVSVSASIATVNFFKGLYAAIGFEAFDNAPQFDSRVVECDDEDVVTDYFRWRQTDALRCALNGLVYWTLRKDGVSAGKATSLMSGMTKEFKGDKLLRDQYGIEFNKLPSRFRHGVGVGWELYTKEGYNPVKDEKVVVERRRLATYENLETNGEYAELLYTIMSGMKVANISNEN